MNSIRTMMSQTEIHEKQFQMWIEVKNSCDARKFFCVCLAKHRKTPICTGCMLIYLFCLLVQLNYLWHSKSNRFRHIARVM